MLQICGRMFHIWSTFQSHMLTHSDEKPHSCHICGKAFRVKSTLKAHLKSHESKRNYCCSLCPAAFKLQHNLARHTKIHFNPTEHKCLQCNKTFSTIYGLNAHGRLHKPLSVTCPICNRCFKSLNSLKIHQLHHKYSSSPLLECKVCNKSYRFASLLRRHEKLHENVYDHHCTKCTAKFVWKSSLVHHLQTHIPKQFKCQICSETFGTNRKLNSHMKTHEVNQSPCLDSKSKSRRKLKRKKLPAGTVFNLKIKTGRRDKKKARKVLKIEKRKINSDNVNQNVEEAASQSSDLDHCTNVASTKINYEKAIAAATSGKLKKASSSTTSANTSQMDANFPTGALTKSSCNNRVTENLVSWSVCRTVAEDVPQLHIPENYEDGPMSRILSEDIMKLEENMLGIETSSVKNSPKDPPSYSSSTCMNHIRIQRFHSTPESEHRLHESGIIDSPMYRDSFHQFSVNSPAVNPVSINSPLINSPSHASHSPSVSCNSNLICGSDPYLHSTSSQLCLSSPHQNAFSPHFASSQFEMDVPSSTISHNPSNSGIEHPSEYCDELSPVYFTSPMLSNSPQISPEDAIDL